MELLQAFNQVETPSYVVSKDLLINNLLILKDVEEKTGAHILLAQKAFSMFETYDIIRDYISGATASSLNEAILGYEYMKKENHIFAPAYKESEMPKILEICDHVVFNSFSQYEKYKDLAREMNVSCGIRINPEYSTQEGNEMYDPCAMYSRMGVTLDVLKTHDISGIEGIHFHTLCEQNSDALISTLKVIEDRFGEYLHKMKWVNFGGGHHITRADYDVLALIDCIIKFKAKYNVEVYLEPGEAVALDTGFLVSEVMDVINNKMDIAILDASAACHMPDVLEVPYRPRIYGIGNEAENEYTYRLGGNTCLSGDVIGDYTFKRKLKCKDRIVFEDMSIYSMVKNNTFNGINLPSIYLFSENSGLKLIKKFGYEDFKMRLS